MSKVTQPFTAGAVVLLLLGWASCREQPALLADQQAGALVGELQIAFSKSVDAEKSAVLASSDAQSEAFAAESRAAARRVERVRTELRERLSRPASIERLNAFDKAWADVVAVDARLLPLAVANTNLKAAKLSNEGALAAVNRFVDSLAVLGERVADLVSVRAAARASVAALRIQALHAPHIAALDEPVMAALEARTLALKLEVRRELATLASRRHLKGVEPAPGLPFEPWQEFERLTDEIFRLSRQNSNVISYELSTHGKRTATVACQGALEKLIDDLQQPMVRGAR